MDKELKKLLEEILNEGYGLKNVISDIFTSYPNEIKTVLTRIMKNIEEKNMTMKEQLFKDLDKFRGYTFTDEEARKFCDVFGPILVENGFTIIWKQ